MAFRKKFSKKTFRKNGKRPVRAKRSRKVSSLRKLVKKEISRAAETKIIQAENMGLNLNGANSGNFASNIWTLGPSPAMPISQGTGVGNRIGNRITTRRLTVKGHIVPLPYNEFTNGVPQPYVVKLVMFYDKTSPTGMPNPTTNFFQINNNNRGFTGDLVDMDWPVNVDRYRILATKTLKVGYSASNFTGYAPTYQAFQNNDFKMNGRFSFNLTKHFPKVVTFDENSSTSTSRPIFMMAFFAAGSGTIVTNTQIPLQLSYMQEYHFDDM